MVHRHDAWIGTILLAAAVFAGCGGPLGGLTARASDEWTRTYLLANGEVQITNPNVIGGVSIEVKYLDLMGEQTRRRVRGRLNGGGAPIELTTTNGPIRVALR